jgi:hypothetical protein
MELPGYQGPFYQDIDIDDDKIACTIALDHDEPGYFCKEPDEQ